MLPVPIKFKAQKKTFNGFTVNSTTCIRMSLYKFFISSLPSILPKFP